METKRKYGYIPDLPDQRDVKYYLRKMPNEQPSKVDLHPQMPPVYDQGNLGSCTANGIAGAIEFDLMKQKIPVFMPSRLFIYYNERKIEHTIGNDSGAQIRDGIKTVNKDGVCSEITWPYIIDKFTKRPTPDCYKEAKKHQAVQYQRVPRNLDYMKGVIAEGYPFIFGFSVYESFESVEVAKSGILNMPGSQEQLLGGHCVMAVGYDMSSYRFIVRNSWGTGWGQTGYFTMPFGYLMDENLSDDFWVIKLVES